MDIEKLHSGTTRADLADKLQRRGDSLIRISWGYLAAIAILVGIAVTVFIFAAAISRNDSLTSQRAQKTNIKQQISDINTKVRREEDDINSYRMAFNQPFHTLFLQIESKIQIDKGYISTHYCCDEQFDSHVFADELRKVLASDPEAPDPFAIYLTVPSGSALRFSFNRAEWERYAQQIDQIPMPIGGSALKSTRTEADQLTRDKAEESHLQHVQAEMESQSVTDEAHARLGLKAPLEANSQATTKLQLIQTSVTRFGTISLIVFLVSILSGLYRYTVKLAAFYRAQADALSLSATADRRSDLETFSKLLTPKLDFGRTPPTPVDQLSELLKAAGKMKDLDGHD